MALTKDNTYVDENKRLIYISDDIDNSSMGQICWSLLYLLQEDEEKEEKEKNFVREPIKIYVNSYGGSVYDMWALIDIMLSSKTPIYTYCTGYAMSAAFNIFLAGHQRYASKRATFMYHQISCWRCGKYQDLVEDRAEMDWLQKSMEDYVIERTNFTQDKLDEIREKKIDVYLHSEEALKRGIINEII